MRSISLNFASKAILAILSLVILFHLLVMIGLIPYGIVWGGRLESASEMLTFELASVLFNLLIMFVIAMRVGYLKSKLSINTFRIIFWILTVLFILNTLGNIFSESKWEAIIFTPITLLLSLLYFRLARSDNKS